MDDSWDDLDRVDLDDLINLLGYWDISSKEIFLSSLIVSFLSLLLRIGFTFFSYLFEIF